MPAIQIRNFPQELYDKLQDSAETSHRSLSQEVIVLIKKALSTDNDSLTLRKRKAIEKIKSQVDLDIYNTVEVGDWIRKDRDGQ